MPDANGRTSVTTTSDLATFGDNALKSAIYFDGLGRQVEAQTYETASTYVATTQTYDALGRLWKVADPFVGTPGNLVEAEYDALDRPLRMTHSSDSAVTRHCYKGDAVYTRDAAGKWRSSQHDALGRIRNVTEDPQVTAATGLTACAGFENPGGVSQVTEYTWDGSSNLRIVTQGQQTRTFQYDWAGRLEKATNPESRDTCYGTVSAGACTAQYDGNGNLLYRTDAEGRVVSYTWDALNRLEFKSYSDGTPAATWVWDTVRPGSLTRVENSRSKTEYPEYDTAGRPKRVAQTTGGPVYALDYRYNLAGGLKYLRYPSGQEVSAGFDGAGRVNLLRRGATEAGGCTTEADCYVRAAKYGADGGVSDLELGNGVQETIRRNARLQPLWIEAKAGATSLMRLDYCWTATADGTCAASGTDNNGNVRSQRIGPLGVTQMYSYDALNRLLEGGEGALWKESNVYDRFGNRTLDMEKTFGIAAVGFSVDAATNQLAGVAHDLTGNQRFVSPYELAYDAEGRLIAATSASNGSAAYRYDGEGRRVQRITCGEATGCSGTEPDAVTTTYAYL